MPSTSVDRQRQRRAAFDGEEDLVLVVPRGIDDDRLHLVIEVERAWRVEGAVARPHAALPIDADDESHAPRTLPDVRVRRSADEVLADVDVAVRADGRADA